MTITAEDENGREFIKEVSIINRANRNVLSLGSPYEWELNMLREYPPKNDIMYIDAAGRNHARSTVFCSYSELMKIADTIEKNLNER